jgi:hypothetical protein
MSAVCGSCGHQVDVDCTCPRTGWWHAYGAVREDLGGCWQLVVVGPAEKGPEVAQGMEFSGCPYLASWDHHPSDAEKDEITPEEYRDEVPA